MKVAAASAVLGLLASPGPGAVAAPRLVIGENFTNTYCVPCAQYDPVLDSWLSDRVADIALVSYHSWWPVSSDIFYQFDITENTARINYYGVAGVPSFFMDGFPVIGMGASTWNSALAGRLASSAPLTIIPSATYNSATHSGTLSASITNVSASTVNGYFRVAVTESVYYLTPGGNGYPVNSGTMRDMVPDATGTVLTLAPGAGTVINLPYTLPSAPPPSPPLDPNRCEIVCWVQSASVSREILQGARLIFPFDGPYLVLGSTSETPQPGGDGDAFVDAGENGRLVVTVNNINAGAATGAIASLTTSDPFITITDGNASLGTIPGFGSASNDSDPFLFTTAPGTPSGYLAQCTLTVNSGPTAYIRTMALGLEVGSPTDPIGPAGIYYSYENGDAPTFIERPTQPFDSLWVEIDSTLGGPGHRSAHFDDGVSTYPLGFSFRYYGVSYDTLTISSNGWIALGAQAVALGAPDPVPLPDAGSPRNIIAGAWSDLSPPASAGGRIWRYYDAANHRYIVEYNKVHHARRISYETFEIILHDPAYYPTATGDGVILVLYKHVGEPTYLGAGIQNDGGTAGITYSCFGHPSSAAVGLANGRVIKYTPNPPLRTDIPAPDQPAGGPNLLVASPNPFTTTTRIAFRLPEREAATLAIYRIDGRLVARLFDGVAEAGTTVARWDGADSGGRPVAPGLYLARLESCGGSNVGKILVLR